jgi:uncharacterized membrane protein
MDITFKTLSLLAATILTGLSAGLFYAWSVSVIPGTKNLGDFTYLETMQVINRAILNPAFFTIFFGSSIMLGTISIIHFTDNKLLFGLIVSACVIYLFGTVGVTGLGNVPLNNQLDILDLKTLTANELKTFRMFYEQRWNKLHMVRMVFSVIAFLIMTCALLIKSKH